MAKNDLILLDALLDQAAPNYPQFSERGTLFEFFVLDHLLKDYDLSEDELSDGWVDGGNDGGIDGFFLFIDGLPLTDKPKASDVRKNAVLEVVIVTCKHEDSFRQIPINNLLASLPDLFDLSKSRGDILTPYNDNVLDQRDLFCETYKEIASRQPQLRVSYYYTSRGDTSALAGNVSSRGESVLTSTRSLFSDCDAHFVFLGASELLTLARKQRATTLRLTFIENFVSRAKSNYIVLVRLIDYYRFITDDEGNLRRYLFESNVRDFLGANVVNHDIATSLRAVSRIDECDFWWLNNGVTIIATSANSAGKELNLENIQIVNGLQTTETTFAHYKSHPSTNDERAILVKIIVTKDDEVRDRIIKATNFQTTVDAASLRATDKIQRDIEDLLQKENWFYDRRKNFHKNQGRPSHRVVSPLFVASGVMALVLKKPTRASRLKSRFMQNDSDYREVFDPNFDIRVYGAVVEIIKNVERAMIKARLPLPGVEGRRASDFRNIFSFLWMVGKKGAKYFTDADILTKQGETPTPDEMKKIWAFLSAERIAGSFNERRLYRNSVFFSKLLEKLNDSSVAGFLA
jgi:hypothetical protein